mmetsp:Transcript_13429/g.25730  ORF Transcript_13429/g.25730 Transcript_13429/m.25730 type:complete len:205 (-) Transcript_13429:1143-1757(-)
MPKSCISAATVRGRFLSLSGSLRSALKRSASMPAISTLALRTATERGGSPAVLRTLGSALFSKRRRQRSVLPAAVATESTHSLLRSLTLAFAPDSRSCLLMSMLFLATAIQSGSSPLPSRKLGSAPFFRRISARSLFPFLTAMDKGVSLWLSRPSTSAPASTIMGTNLCLPRRRAKPSGGFPRPSFMFMSALFSMSFRNTRVRP